MATTLLDRQQKQLIKKFHTLLGKAGIGQSGKEAILAGYGVTSTKELSAYELLEACNALDKLSNPKAAELDTWRKRVIAALFDYFNAVGTNADMDLVKGTACRAAQASSFNRIGLEDLRAIYSGFSKKAKTVRRGWEAANEKINEIKSLN